MNVRRFIPLAAVLAAVSLVFAQPPANKGEPEPKKSAPAGKEPAKPAPGSLEDTLDKALRNSADIKAAEAKVREADAELNRVRQQVLTRAASLHADLNAARRMLAVAEQSLGIQQRAVQRGAAGQDGVLTAQAMVEKHRGDVEKIETDLKSLRGEFAHRGINRVAFSPEGPLMFTETTEGTVRIWDTVTGAAVLQPAAPPAPAVESPMMDRIKKALDLEVDLEIAAGPPNEIMTRLMEVSGAKIPVRVIAATDGDIQIHVKGKLPLGAWIQAVEDSDHTLRIVVREYGLLVTTHDRVPEGALRVQDLWKGNYAQLKSKPAEAKGPKGGK